MRDNQKIYRGRKAAEVNRQSKERSVNEVRQYIKEGLSAEERHEAYLGLMGEIYYKKHPEEVKRQVLKDIEDRNEEEKRRVELRKKKQMLGARRLELLKKMSTRGKLLLAGIGVAAIGTLGTHVITRPVGEPVVKPAGEPIITGGDKSATLNPSESTTENSSGYTPVTPDSDVTFGNSEDDYYTHASRNYEDVTDEELRAWYGIKDKYDEYPDVAQFRNYPGYADYLLDLKELYPNWTFTKWETGEDFEECVEKHYQKGSVTVCDDGDWGREWFFIDENGNYVKTDTPNYCIASKECVAAMMDPRNFLNQEQIFQFEIPNMTAENISLDDVKKMFSNVEWANAEKFSYMDANKQIVTLDESFSELLYRKCKEYNFNPLSAASSIIIEQGRGSEPGAYTGRGNIEGYEGLYNYGNIGAYSEAYEGVHSAGICGLIRAREEGWTTPEAAIEGYIEYEMRNLNNNGKDCKYQKKFDIKGDGSNIYMTAYAGAYNEARVVYQSANLDQPHEFKIPVFENMPEELCELPGKPGMKMESFNGGIKGEKIQEYDDSERG